MISVRIDSDLKDYLDRNNYVMTDVVRSVLINFVKMDVDNRIRFLAENRETFADIQTDEGDWIDIVRNGLAEYFGPDTIDKLLKTDEGIVVLNKLKELSRMKEKKGGF